MRILIKLIIYAIIFLIILSLMWDLFLGESIIDSLVRNQE